MDPKEIKAALKEARDAIKAKEYKTALKHCKAILKADKENYNAWVFLGAAAQETDQMEQAETAFRRAIELQEDQLLAWQGLCSFYEKKDDKSALCDTLQKVVKLLSKDKTKQLESVNKLLAASRELGDPERILEALDLKSSVVEDASPTEDYEIWKEVFTTACKRDLHETLCIKVLHKIAASSLFSALDCKNLIETCLVPLYKDNKCDKSVEFAYIIMKTGHSSCLEFLLKASIDSYIKTRNVLTRFEEMLSLAENCPVAEWLLNIAQGLQSIIQKDYVNALSLVGKGVSKKRNYPEAWLILSNVQLILHLNSDSENSAKTGLKAALAAGAASDLIGKLYLVLGKAFCASRNWEASLKSIEKCVECLGRSAETLRAFCDTLLEMGHVHKAQQIYSELYSVLENEAVRLQLEGYLHILRKEHAAALEKLRQSVSLEESAFTLHLIGRVLWEMKQTDKALKLFVKAVELDPYFSRNFIYLGHYYMQFLNDKRKAKQCYQKAFDLDNTNEEAWMPLSSVLKELGENDANLEVLYKVTKQPVNQNCKYAWTQLGLCQLQNNQASDAVFSLQKAVGADPFSSYAWECLGDAYLKRGSYESSLKAFEKAAELDPKSMYPLYQVSTIQKSRGFFEDAIEKYKTLLEVKSNYIPALIGLAETLLLLGQKYLAECLFGRARDCFQETLDVLARVSSINPSFCCLWKLAGDACTLPFNLDDSWFPLTVPAALEKKLGGDLAPCTKKQLVSFGAKFYGQALTLKEDMSSLWHDLGTNYSFQSILSFTPKDKEDFSKKSLICLQKAVSLAPTRHEHWTALGVIASNKEIQDYGLAQHAFIKSIEIESNNAEAWSNLGVLYLANDNIELAHEAFKVAQSLDHSFPFCWIGQAVIAHKVQHDETIDLYRHATTLGSQNEALLGYGRVVCKALSDTSNRTSELYKYNIEEMDAVSVASDCVTKYIANNKRNPEAYNILGLLLERQKLYIGALRAFKKSVELSEEFGKTTEVEQVRANYARLLSILGLHDKAISEYLKLGKVDQSLLCSFALALFKNNNCEKAFEVFQRALNISSTSYDDKSNKSHILVGMAIVAQNLHGEGIPNPAELLLKSTQTHPPSAHGLLALYALGILQKKFSLVEAVQKEIDQFKNFVEYSTPIALLDAVQAYVKNGVRSARNKLLKAIHNQPGNSVLWMQTASWLLQWDTSFANLAATCLTIAVFHGGDKELASQIYTLSRLAVGQKKVSLSAAQKAVHIRPDKLSNWVTLVAGCHVAKADRSNIGWIFGFVQKLAREQGIKQELLGWLVCLEVYHNLYCKDTKQAARYLKQATNVNFPNPKIQSTLQILDAFVSVLFGGEKVESLYKSVESNPSNFLGWQLLTTLLIRGGKLSEAEKALAHFINTSTKHFPKLKTYPLLQMVALSYQAIHTGGDREKMMKRATDFVTEAVKIAPNNNLAARFLQGVLAVEAENISLAKRSLEKVVHSCDSKQPRWMENMAAKLLIPIYVKKKDKEALQKIHELGLISNEELESLLSDIPSEE